MARMLSSTFLRLLLILANAPSAPQISLPSRSGHISPSVAIFLARFRSLLLGFLRLHFGDCSSGTLFSLGEVPWSIVAVNRHVLALSRATTCTVSVLNVWVFRTRARRFTASRNANSEKTSISKPSALGSQFLRGSHPFFPVVLRRLLRPSANPRPGPRMLSSRRWRASRQASPFLSWARAREFSGWIRAWLFMS